jgi:antitoxin HicB
MSMTSTTRTPAEKTRTEKATKANRVSSKVTQLEHYLGLNYPMELVREDDDYVASHPDLPGCVSYGASPNEAVDSLAEVRRLWLRGQIESGNPIPEPTQVDRYSGKFVLRIPKTLHRLVDVRSKQQGVSLNSYISCVLAGALGFPNGEESEKVSLS